MGKEEKSKRILRGVKTVFFLITMILSLLLFSAPVLLVIADALVPSALLSTLSLETLSSHFHNYDFRYSLIDIPLVSIIRSFIIFCVYSLCDGPRLSRGPYLGITTVCCVLSLMFVSFKAVYIFSLSGADRSGHARASEIALFVCSCALALGHVVVAYRTSCRERRKLLVYKIDIEAVNILMAMFALLVVVENHHFLWNARTQNSIWPFIFSFGNIYQFADFSIQPAKLRWLEVGQGIWPYGDVGLLVKAFRLAKMGIRGIRRFFKKKESNESTVELSN